MRSIIAPVVLIAIAGCSSLQRPASVRRAAASAAACDTAASIAAERAQLASVARTLGDMSNGAAANASSTMEPRISSPNASAAPSRAPAAAATASMIANAKTARVEIWNDESRLEQNHYQAVVARIAALDATARTLPKATSCRAAGFASFTDPTG